MRNINKYIRIAGLVLSVILIIHSLSGLSFASADTAEVRVTGEKAGNIFFDNDIPKFDIVLKNNAVTEQKFTLSKEVFLHELSGEIVSKAKNEEQITLDGGRSVKRAFEYEADKYGIYTLKVVVLNESGETVCEKSVEFSKAVENENQNPNHGVCVHLVRMGDTDTELNLAAKAGFSMVRDDFTWSEYEVSKGDMRLSQRQSELLKKAEKYDLELLAIVGGDNKYYNPYYDSSKPTLPYDLDAFAVFVESLITEKGFDNVKRIELQNEPQAKYVIDNSEYYYGQYNIEKAAAQYAEQLISAANVIRSKRPDIEIGAFSLCLTGQEATDSYITAVYDYLNENNAGALPFDTITMHPYTNRAGMTTGETVEHYKNVAADSGFDKNNTDVWCTEYGLYTSDIISQAEQARYIIKAYTDMKSKRFTDDLYVYDLADDGGTYGLIKHSSDTDVPYAAKYSYLAVSNLNKLTYDAEACDKIENNAAEIYKFSCLTGDVYMVRADEEVLFEYDFGEEVCYYDMLGNELEESDVKNSGAYYADESPYYVTVGKKSLPAEQKGFVVSGNIESEESDKNVSITVLKEDILFDENMKNEIQYAEQQKTGADGSFEFIFDLPDKTKDLVAYVVSEDSLMPLDIRLSGEHKALRLYSGTTEINSLNLNLLDLSDASVEISFKNIDNRDRYYMICGFYKESQLVHAEIRSGMNAGDTEVYDVSVTEGFDYDRIKIFLFDSLNTCVPLCAAEILG